jgi:GMP synthase (glutamine-hydrolysing)
MRQPFPGPGLAIRVLCAEEAFGLEQYDAVNGQLQSLAAENGYQAVLAPVRSVGVQGDGRSYSYLALLTAPQPVDASDWPKLRELAREIPNRIRAINRVALVLNRSQLPTSIKTVTPTWLNRPTLDRLRRLDHTTTEAFKAAGCLSRISQLLTVLVPVDTAGQGRHSVAIMTARPASLGRDIPWALLHTLTEQLDADPDVDLVMVDMTGKPPATVEWE